MKKLSEISKRCEQCRKKFTPYIRAIKWQRFCSKKCAVKSYKEKGRIKYFKKKAEEKKHRKYPKYVCPKCGKITKLDFYPQSDKRWIAFKCECEK